MVICFQCQEEITVSNDNESIKEEDGSSTIINLFQDRAKHPYCKSCWCLRILSRVRRRLAEVRGGNGDRERGGGGGRNNVEKALIYFDMSSKSSSMALLGLCRQAMETNSNTLENPRNLAFPFEFTVVSLIEHERIVGMPRSRQEQIIEDLRGWLSSTGIEVEVIDGEEMYPQVLGVWEEIKSVTGKNDFLDVVRWKILLQKAQKLNISVLMVPDNQTSMASKMFTLMSLGRGGQVAGEMALSSQRNGVRVCRVLMDFTEPELAQIVGSLDDLPNSLTRAEKRNSQKKVITSLDAQCSDFITTLQEDYPSTVSTLTRIGGKLQSNHTREEKDECRFCGRLQDDVDDTDINPSVNEWCYGCRNILKEMRNPQQLLILVSELPK